MGWSWAVVLAWLLDGLVLVHVPVCGVCARLLPGVVYLAGVESGPEVGAKCGLLGGGLLWVCGASASQMAILALLGGIAGEVIHKSASHWGKWLGSLPLLAGAEGLVLGVHWLGSVPLAQGLWLAGPEVGLEIAGTGVLCFGSWLWQRRRMRRGRR